MGLFGRRKQRDAERERRERELDEQISTLNAEITALRGRLESTEAERDQLTGHLSTLDESSQRMLSSIGTMATTVDGIDRRLSDSDLRMAGLDGRIAAVDGRIADGDASVSDLRTVVDALGEDREKIDARIDELGEAIDGQRRHLEDVVLVASDTARKVEAIDPTGRETDGDAALAELTSQLGKIAERVGSLDTRVNQVSVELTNQLTELSNELDELHRSAAADAEAAGESGVDDETSDAIIGLVEERIDQIVSGQRRLAEEQTRYEIQFREDLAELAERIRRPAR